MDKTHTLILIPSLPCHSDRLIVCSLPIYRLRRKNFSQTSESVYISPSECQNPFSAAQVGKLNWDASLKHHTCASSVQNSCWIPIKLNRLSAPSSLLPTEWCLIHPAPSPTESAIKRSPCRPPHHHQRKWGEVFNSIFWHSTSRTDLSIYFGTPTLTPRRRSSLLTNLIRVIRIIVNLVCAKILFRDYCGDYYL